MFSSAGRDLLNARLKQWLASLTGCLSNLKKHKEKRSRAKVQDDTRKKSYSFDYIVEPEEKIS